jgi:PAS domain S-box-containing protein
MRSRVIAYGVALAVVAAALLARVPLFPILGDRIPFITLFPAVAFVAWYGGRGPALLAIVASALGISFFLLEPLYSFAIRGIDYQAGLVLFVFIGLGFVAMFESLRAARQQEAEQRERLRTTLSSIGDAILATDTQGRVTTMNEVAESLTGWKKEEAAGQHLDKVFRIVNEHTRQPVQSPAVKAMEQGVIVGLANHTILIAKDGSERPIDDSASPIRCAKGEVVGCVLVFRDVTNRRRAEQRLSDDESRLRSIVNHVVDGIIAIDENGTVEAFNPAAERLFGYRTEEVVGQNVKLLMPEPFHGEHDGYLANYRRTGQPRIIGIGREVAGRRKDGSTFAMELAVSEFLLGGRRYFTGIVRDVTEQKRAAEALREADRRKDEFLATLAHELRNPLAPIRNAIQVLIAKGPPDSELKWCRDVIDRQVQHMARLLEDLLDVSRITHDKLELRNEYIELSAPVRNAVETSRPSIDRREQRLTLTLPPEPVYLDADPVRLAQVFSNLLNNASKFSEPGGHIEFTCERQGTDVVVSVKDDGIGIDAEMLPRIFDIFSQAKGGSERSPEGLGIGLSLVRGLVELHGGSLEARSAGMGRGSEFIVRLPVTENVVPEVAPANSEDDKPIVKKRRLLIADDLKDNADSLAMLLRVMGHDVHTAYDGEDAVVAAERFKPDMVLLDIGMPRLNGYDACRRIRHQSWSKGVVFVALTGWGQADDRRRSKEAGFNHHLIKPVDPGELMNLLASHDAKD